MKIITNDYLRELQNNANAVIVNIEFTKNVDLETTIFGELIVI